MNVPIWAWFPLCLFAVVAAIAQTHSAAPAMDQLVAHEVAILQFAGGGSALTAQERQQAAEAVAMAMHDNPSGWLKVDENVQQLLAKIGAKNAPVTNGLRESIRYNYVFPNSGATAWPKEYAIEKRIIEAHDPVVAVDPAQHRAVTRHTLQFFEQDAVWIARSFNLPGPSADFIPILEKRLETDLVGLQASEPKIADGIAHMERNAWYGPAYFEHLSAEQKKKVFVDSKDATFHDLGDHASEQWQIAEAAALMSRFAASQAPAGGGAMSERVLEMQMAQKAMTGAMRSMSPGCNVTVGSYSDRAANNCYPH